MIETAEVYKGATSAVVDVHSYLRPSAQKMYEREIMINVQLIQPSAPIMELGRLQNTRGGKEDLFEVGASVGHLANCPSDNGNQKMLGQSLRGDETPEGKVGTRLREYGYQKTCGQPLPRKKTSGEQVATPQRNYCYNKMLGRSLLGEGASDGQVATRQRSYGYQKTRGLPLLEEGTSERQFETHRRDSGYQKTRRLPLLDGGASGQQATCRQRGYDYQQYRKQSMKRPRIKMLIQSTPPRYAVGYYLRFNIRATVLT